MRKLLYLIMSIIWVGSSLSACSGMPGISGLTDNKKEQAAATATNPAANPTEKPKKPTAAKNTNPIASKPTVTLVNVKQNPTAKNLEQPTMAALGPTDVAEDLSISATRFPTQPINPGKPTPLVITATPGEKTDDTQTSGDYFNEEFSQEPQGWKRTFVTGENVLWDFFFEDDRLKIMLPGYKDATKVETYLYYTNENISYGDVAIEAEAENKGVSHNAMGVTCRMNERGWYEFRIGSDGKYYLYRFEQRLKEKKQNPYKNLAEGASTFINPGKNKVNTYSLECKGTQLRMFVNGTELLYKKRIVEDDMFEDGFVGIALFSFLESNGEVNVEFEKVTTGAPRD